MLFATPCHQTPFYSHVHADVAMSFLDCSPDVPPGEDASARFAADPALYLSTTYDIEETGDYMPTRSRSSLSSSSTPTRAAPPTGSPLATTDSQNLSTTPTSRSTASSSVECSSRPRRADASVSMSPFLTVCPYTYPDTPDPPPNRPALVSARPSSSTRVAMRDARRRESRPSDERYVRALRKKLREATAKTIELAAAGTIEKSDDARDDDDDVERRLARWRSTVEDTLVKLRGAGFSNVDDERRRGEEDAKEVIGDASERRRRWRETTQEDERRSIEAKRRRVKETTVKSDALWWMHSMAKREGEEMDVEKMIERATTRERDASAPTRNRRARDVGDGEIGESIREDVVVV